MRRWYRWLVWIPVLALGVTLVWWMQRPSYRITLRVLGREYTYRVHGTTVADALADIGFTPRPEDRVSPPVDTPLHDGMSITVERSRPILVDIHGRRRLIYTRGQTPRDVLQEGNIHLEEGDVLRVEGQPVSPDTRLPPPHLLPGEGIPQWEWPIQPLWLYIRRAVPIRVWDNGVEYTIRTTAPTVGEALREAGVEVYLGDEVFPSLGEPVHAHMRVVIQRSTRVVVQVDGATYQTRTRASTVADVLAELGIYVRGLDRITPGLSAPVQPDMRVHITRMEEYVQVDDERIPYETVFVPDDSLEIDHRRLVSPGRPGIFRRRYRITLADGTEVSRVLEDAWTAQEPITHVIAYGRRIITRTLETPDGAVVYWRRIRMLATSYSASTAGVSPTNPWFGYTRLGMKMRKGIVAVDPRVIPLGSRVYVPGYGIGFAGDTGSRILGRRIDLGYDDWNLVLWNQWVDVYVLTPPPPKDKINYFLPNWPRPPGR